MTIFKIIITPLIVSVLVEFIKLIPEALHGEFKIKNILKYGGMPSGHAAFVASLTTMVMIVEGFNSVIFAVTLVFSLLIIRDSIGFRRILGTQNREINIISQELFNHSNETPPRLIERLGHSFLEVAVGTAVGFLLTIIINSYVF